MEFKLFEKTNRGLKCNLCPHFCILKKNQIGKCHARFNNGEAIVHKKLGAVSCLAIESMDKKPFKHFLSDTKTLSVGGWGCNLNCEFCLPPDSLISTPKGQVRIDQIEDGDEIVALDNLSAPPQLVKAHVGYVSDREAEEVIVIEVDGGTLELTPEHPVMTESRGWVEAGDLTSDDEVLCDKTYLK